MKIYLASDHAGFDLKESIKKYLIEQSLEVEDQGAYEKNPEDDYPDWISKGGEKVSQDSGSMGIFFGKSGAGEAIVANKFKNIRAVVGFNNENVKLAREHNDANVLCIGTKFIGFEDAKEFVDIFLNTPFSNEERHIRRIQKISSIEQK